MQDPRNFDGDCYQAAERAIRQLRGVLTVAETLIAPTELMARNAELERQLALGNDLGKPAVEWPLSPQGAKVTQVRDSLASLQRTLSALERAVAYNPKAR